MKCTNCAKELPPKASVCPECGTVTPQQGLTLGDDIETYFEDQPALDKKEPQATGDAPPPTDLAKKEVTATAKKEQTKKEATKTKPTKAEETVTQASAMNPVNQESAPEITEAKTIDLGDEIKRLGEKTGSAVKTFGGKVKTKAKDIGGKMKETADSMKENMENQEATLEAEDATGESGESGGTGKKWIPIAIAAAAVVILAVVIVGVLGIDTAKDFDENYVLVARSDQELYLIDGTRLKTLAEDIPNNVWPYQTVFSANGKQFYTLNDIKEDEVTTGDLTLWKSEKNQKNIDDDVILGSVSLVGDALWYKKAEGKKTVLYSYKGGKIREITDDILPQQSYRGLPDGKTAYYNEDSDLYVNIEGDDDKIAKDARLVGISEDYKKLLIMTDDRELIIYDGKNEFEVADDVDNYHFDPKSCDCLVIDDKGDLIYVPFNKDGIDIDDDVENVLLWGATYKEGSIGNKVLYLKEDDLYLSDTRGKNNERILKDIEELFDASWADLHDGKIMWNEDEEINMLDLRNLKETKFDLDNADEITDDRINFLDGLFVYMNDDDELCATTNGKKTIMLSKEGEDITDYQIEKGGKRVFWVEDEDLYVSPVREDSAERLIKDVYDFTLSKDGSVYAVADYDFEDGGELSLLKNKNPEHIEKDILDIYRVYYGD